MTGAPNGRGRVPNLRRGGTLDVNARHMYQPANPHEYWARGTPPLSARNTSIPVDANAYGDFSFSAHHQTRGESARDRGIPPPSLSSTIPSRTSDLPAQASSPGDARTNPSPPCRTHAPVHQRATAAPLSTITNAIVITPATARCRRRCPAPARPGRSRTQQPRRGQVESREQNIRHTRLNSRHKSDEYPSTTTFALLETQAPHTRASTRIHRKPRTSKP